ncbi:hypothetical protein Trisim1_001444 [Trichoderma cf. simile WF8]
MTTVDDKRAPCLFISHGTGPFPLLDPEQQAFREMLRKHGSKLDGVKGILLFSAHWETKQPHITMGDEPGLYYDYEDQRAVLPKEAFEFQYAAKGDSQLAVQIAAQLQHRGFKPVLERRGFDHAVYVPMILMRPQADIPIVQMSVLRGETDIESTELNIQLGQAVESFRDRGYAVIGSGGSYHDFQAIAKAYFENKFVPAESSAFEDFLESAASIQDPKARAKALLGWRSLSSSYLAHVEGSSEHLMPFMVAAGSGGGHGGVKFDMYTYKGATMSQYIW